MEARRTFEHFLGASFWGASLGKEEGSALLKGDAEKKEQQDPQVSVPRESLDTAQAEPIGNGSCQPSGVESFAMLPGALRVAVPTGWKPGDKVSAQGPHGRIWLELPHSCTAGTTIRYRLRPAPDLVVEVPPGASAGSVLSFRRPDKTQISIEVPQGTNTGEKFEVRPPALMVLVPEGVKPGSHVVFRAPTPGGVAGNQWLRAQVPNVLQLGRYFAARLPPPGAPQGAAIPWSEEQETKVGSSAQSVKSAELEVDEEVALLRVSQEEECFELDNGDNVRDNFTEAVPDAI